MIIQVETSDGTLRELATFQFPIRFHGTQQGVYDECLLHAVQTYGNDAIAIVVSPNEGEPQRLPIGDDERLHVRRLLCIA